MKKISTFLFSAFLILTCLYVHGQQDDVWKTQLTCQSNLVMINAAKLIWRIKNGKTMDAVPAMPDLKPYLYSGANEHPPVCPSGGSYIINALSRSCQCSIPAHSGKKVPVDPRTECMNNLRLIDGAKQYWALLNKKTSQDLPTVADILPELGRGTATNLPPCPSGGVYTLNSVGTLPQCSIPSHRLDH